MIDLDTQKALAAQLGPEMKKQLAEASAELRKSLLSDTVAEVLKALREESKGKREPLDLTAAPGGEAERQKWLRENDRFKGLGLGFARCVISHARAKVEGGDALSIAKRLGFTEEVGLMEQERDRRRAAMQASTHSAGAAFIPPTYSAEFIALLQVTAELMNIGMTNLEMTGPELPIPRLTSGTSAYWVGENEAPTLSDVGTGTKSMTLREIAARSIVSELLLQFAPNFEAIVRDQLLADFGRKLSATGWRSAGGAKTPRGLRYLVDQGQVMHETGTGYAQALADLYNLMGLVTDKFVPRDSLRWAFCDRVKRGLCQLQSAGLFPFKEGLESAQPRLLGYPVTLTQEFPSNLGGSSNETEIAFGAARLLWHGYSTDMAVKVSTEAAVKDGNTMRSMFDERSMAIQLYGQHTFMLQHDEAWAYIDDSTLGAPA